MKHVFAVLLFASFFPQPCSQQMYQVIGVTLGKPISQAGLRECNDQSGIKTDCYTRKPGLDRAKLRSERIELCLIDNGSFDR